MSESTAGYTPRRTVAAIGLAVLTLAAVWVGYRFSEGFHVAREIEASARRAAPHLTSLISVMERYQTLPPILSEDRGIVEAAEGAPPPTLNERLERYAESTGADAIYLMDDNGWTITASNWNSPQTFLGQNYGFRPYFKDALSGRSGEYFAIGATTGIPGYFVSHPVKTDEGQIVGAIAVKVDLRRLEADWEDLEEKVFVVNADGVIVLSGEHRWRYHPIGALDSATREHIAARKQFGQEPLTPLGVDRDGVIVSVDQVRFVEHTAAVGRLGWTLGLLKNPVLGRSERRIMQSWPPGGRFGAHGCCGRAAYPAKHVEPCRRPEGSQGKRRRAA